MALKIELKDEKGIVATYHRIGVVSQEYGKTISINLFGYADETYRENEKGSDLNLVLINTPITLDIIDDDFSRENLYKRIVNEVEIFSKSEYI